MERFYSCGKLRDIIVFQVVLITALFLVPGAQMQCSVKSLLHSNELGYKSFTHQHTTH